MPTPSVSLRSAPWSVGWQGVRHSALGLLLCASASGWASDAPAEKHPSIGKITLPAKPASQEGSKAAEASKTKEPVSKESMGDQVRELVEQANASNQQAKGKKGKAAKTPPPKVTLTIEAEPKKSGARGTPSAPPDIAAAYARAHGAIPNPVDSRAAAMAQVAGTGQRTGTVVARENLGVAHKDEAHWAYDGEYGPQAWAKLKPEFNLCAIGQRQSPIAIQDDNTLQGPAEPLQIRYQPSSAMVVNNGHTIQVDVVGDNTITVRGSTYKLVQFHFHTPSEERINDRAYAMVAHLVHRNIDGQLAVLAVLLDPGKANPLINKVWTYMPLDVGDRVRMPAGLLDLSELLPQDQRYYQFMGSLTTPPCSENVLWMVLKQPVQISPEQLRMFAQLYPHNNRPVQPLNGRVVREGM
ncbi:MAG: carbonic anhydrase family protein [Burkholderiales bacterium]|nr:carbonic anhydrase family protein [Burkholderiales bacterium]